MFLNICIQTISSSFGILLFICFNNSLNQDDTVGMRNKKKGMYKIHDLLFMYIYADRYETEKKTATVLITKKNEFFLNLLYGIEKTTSKYTEMILK